MSNELETRRAARERLFDALLTDAVEAEAADPTAHGSASRWWLLAAGLLLGLIVTIGVAVLRRSAPQVTQDPLAFDPVFPQIEWDRWIRPVHTPLTPVQDIAPGHDGRLPRFVVADPGIEHDQERLVRTLLKVTDHPGVRALAISDLDGPLPMDVWRRIDRMPDLEVLSITEKGRLIEAAGLRELRHAPRLRCLQLMGAFTGELTAADAAAVLELPHLSCLELTLMRRVPNEFFLKLCGLPHLRELHVEQCGFEEGWAKAIGQLRSLRLLFLAARRPINRAKDELTATDLQDLAAIPDLESLTIATRDYDLDRGWIEALPPSIEVLRLFGAALSATDIERLSSRGNLRGLHLGALTPEGKHALAERLPALDLERFGCGSLTPELWQALEQTTNLRSLSVTLQDLAEDLARCAEHPSLEQLDLSARIEIEPSAFEVLRKLPRLRRLTLKTLNARIPRFDDPAALREILGPTVHVAIR